METKDSRIDELIKEKDEFNKELSQLKKELEKQTNTLKKCLTVNKKLLVEKVKVTLSLSFSLFLTHFNHYLVNIREKTSKTKMYGKSVKIRSICNAKTRSNIC
jgi:hypothetical protein